MRRADVTRRIGGAAIFSVPRLAGAVASAALLAVDQLFVQGALIEGSPGAGLLVVTIPLAASLYVAATIGQAVLSALPLARHAPGRWAGALVLPAVAAVTGGLSSSGVSERLGLALMAALAAGVVERPLRTALPRHAGTRVTATVLVVALLVAVPMLSLIAPPDAYQNNVGTGGVPSTGNVVVIGLDGVDWTIFNELVARGVMPNCAAIADSGLLEPLRTLSPTSSPFIWNSIYTGFSPDAHRRRPIARAPFGRVLLAQPGPRSGIDPVTAIGRVLGWRVIRYPFALWDILASAGYETAVIGSWEHLPVPDAHHAFTATSLHYQPSWDAARHLALGSRRHAWIDPSLTDAMRDVERPPDTIPEAEWRHLFGEGAPIRAALDARYTGDTTPVEQRLARTRAVYASDRLRVGMAEVLMEELPQPYFLFVYIRGIDVVQHCYLHHYRGAVPPEEAALGDIITNYHRIADEWVGRLRSHLDARDVLFVLSDHGVNVDEYQPHEYKTGFHDFAPDGILISSTRRDSVDTTGVAHVFDITPTILSLLGLPVLASMEGRVVPAITERTVTVTDWRTLTPAVYQGGDPRKADPELLELLKSLGYL